jgi:hypothetical protein
MSEYITSRRRTCKTFAATIALPALKTPARLQLLRELPNAHAMVLAQRGARPAPARLAAAADDEGGLVAVTDGDGAEVELDIDAALPAFVRQLMEAFPVAGESVEARIERARELQARLKEWLTRQRFSNGSAPMAASAFPGGNLTQRTVAMLSASRTHTGKPLVELVQLASTMIRAGQVV